MASGIVEPKISTVPRSETPILENLCCVWLHRVGFVKKQTVILLDSKSLIKQPVRVYNLFEKQTFQKPTRVKSLPFRDQDFYLCFVTRSVLLASLHVVQLAFRAPRAELQQTGRALRDVESSEGSSICG